jgi:acyl carrier protein
MRTDEIEIVCFALALHLEVDPSEIDEAMHLERDLGLDPLDLVLVVLRLEEIGEGEFPVGDLEDVFTVKDLADVVRTWNAGPPTVRVPAMHVYAAAVAS